MQADAFAELRAAEQERVNEAGCKAEDWLDWLLYSDREDALELLRVLLRLAAYARVLGDRLDAAHAALHDTT